MGKQAGWYWPWLIVGFMTVAVGSLLIMVFVATNDPGFAVEPDYYQKALDWDAKQAQDRANDDLGWSIELEVAQTRNPDGAVDVTARLVDASGVSIPDARIRVEAFHNARARQVLAGELRDPDEGGAYRTRMPLRRPGLWEFRLQVIRGDQLFTHTTMKELYWR